MKFTNEQQNALDADGRVLVSAAAGSGKTAVLVEKVVRLISDKDNPVDIDKLLIVTFTNAAAGEMKSRISSRLSELIKENPDDFNLKRQKLLIASSSICTIDSLCISLVKEYFYKLSVPYDFKIADNGMVENLQNNCFEKMLDERLSGEDKDFLNLISLFGGERSDEALKENIFKMYEYLCTLPFPNLYIQKVKRLYTEFDENSIFFEIIFSNAYETVKNAYAVFSNAYEELLTDSDLSGFYADAFSEVLNKLGRALELIEAKDYNGIKSMLDNYGNVSLKAARGYSDTDFKERMQAAKKNAEKIFTKLKNDFALSCEEVSKDIERLAPIVGSFLDFTQEFCDRLYNEKLENCCFGFSDIEAMVLKLLVKYEDKEVKPTDEAKELAEKYHLVLVDEYQDTNDLQNTIFNALSSDGDKLFMVGDVKQSIYGFRKANPKNFLLNRESLPNYTPGATRSKVIMSGNFRSADGICDFVNFVFYRLFSKRCGEMFYEKEDELVPKAKFLPIDEARVKLDIITELNEDYSSAENQAYHILNIIKQKMSGGEIISDNGVLRKAEYRDFCILLRSRTEILTIAEALKKAGIPVWVDDNSGLLNEKEIVNLFSLLQVIDNPFSDIPLLSVLMGDIYGFTAEKVAKIRASSKDTELYRALVKNKDDRQVGEFLADIEEFREISAVSSVSSLINKILIKTGYENTVFLYDNGESAYNNLLIFKENAKNFEETSSRGLSAFVGYIKRQIKNGNMLAKSSAAGENDNAVRIMTMHRSKGLQFPICILACLDKKFNNRDNTADVLLTEKCGVGMNFFDSEKRIKYSTLPRNAAKIENNAAQLSEEMRVLYVAMTRAKDMLYLVGARPKLKEKMSQLVNGLSFDENGRFNPYCVLECNNYLSMILACAVCHADGYPLREDIKNNIGVSPGMPISVNLIDKIDFDICGEETVEAGETFSEQKYCELCEVLNYSYRYRDLNKIFVKQSASSLAHREFSSEFDFTREPVFIHNEKLSAAEKGTAMHKFMQYSDFAAAQKDIDSEIKRLGESGKLTLAETQSLSVENLKAFLCSSLCESIIKSSAVYKEKSFMTEVPANKIYDDLTKEFEGEKIIIQGTADLCFEKDDGIFIVDYKTDRVDEEELIKRYTTQLDVYETALADVFGKKIVGKAIYSFYLKKVIYL